MRLRDGRQSGYVFGMLGGALSRMLELEGARMTKLRYGMLAVAMAIGASAAFAGTASAEDKNPWKDWMKANLVGPKTTWDTAKLEDGLKRLKGANPDSKAFPKWAAYCDDGIKAAKAGDKDALNKSCSACHNDYRKTFKEKYRASPTPG